MRAGRLLRTVFLLTAAGLAAVFALAACGDDEEGPQAGEIDISGVSELRDGKLTIGSDIAYAPMEFFEEGTQNATGLDVDLARAMGDLLGVQVEFQQVADFGGIVGDLKAKRYDIIMSSISITPERQAEIDFIQYFAPVGTGILVRTGNPEGIQGIEDLCGKAVAVQSGTYQVQQVEEGINANECAGDPIDLRQFPDNPTAVQELSLGRVVAELADDPVAAYTALQSEGKAEMAVVGFESAPYGIGVRKDSTQLKAVLEEALQTMIDNGTYAQVLKKWGQEAFAVD